eukprot:8756504-Ditylum_brightwellii.AAC.1
MKGTWVCLMETLRLLYHSLRVEIPARKILEGRGKTPFIGVRRLGFGGEGKLMVAMSSHMGRQRKLWLLLSLLLVAVLRDGSSWAGLVAERFVLGDKGGLVAAGSVRMGKIAVALFVLAMVACCREETVGLKPVKL